MPSVLFVGGRLDSVTTNGTVTEATNSFDASYADCALIINAAGAWVGGTFLDSSMAATNLTSGQTGYIHCEFTANTTPSTAANVVWAEDSSGFPWLAVRTTATSGRLGLFYNSGTGASPTWTQIGASFATVAGGNRYPLDIKFTIGAPHYAEFILNNTLIASGTFTQASFTTARVAKFGYLGDSVVWFSQLMVTEGYSTVGSKVKYSRATGAGSNSGWTGVYTNVNEVTNSDATTDTTTTAGVRQTYAMGDVTVPTGAVIASVFVALRAKNDGSVPSNIKTSIRSAGTNYDASANLVGIGVGFNALLQRYDVDPATSAAWTQTNWNAAEAGYLSVT